MHPRVVTAVCRSAAVAIVVAAAVAQPAHASTKEYSPVHVKRGVAKYSLIKSHPSRIRAAWLENSSGSTARLKTRMVRSAARRGVLRVRLSRLRWKSATLVVSYKRPASRLRAQSAAPRTSAPQPRKLPVISGTAQEGQTLTASTGGWHGSPNSYAYQWLRCNSAGSACADVSGATVNTYLLGSGDVGSTMRVRVTATNAYGSTSATSGQTAVVAGRQVVPEPTPEATPEPSPEPTPEPSPAPADFPASFFSGPLGAANIVPGKSTGALFGSWLPGVSGWTWDQQKQLFLDRQSYVGRKYDFAQVHYGAPLGKCYSIAPMSDDRANWSDSNGYTLLLSWTHGWKISEVNSGLADACLQDVGTRLAAYGKPVLLRTYWEFNGDWMNWSGSGDTFIAAWKRTVSKIRAAGATNVGFMWSPASGYYDRAFASYPGDEWVDWVGISAYNRNKAGAWCGPVTPGPWCELDVVLSSDPVKYPTVYDVYSARKPFMLAETGSVEDTATPGRKSQWLQTAAQTIPTRRPNVRGFSYFDVDLTATEQVNWRADTSQASLDGFKVLAGSPFFNTR